MQKCIVESTFRITNFLVSKAERIAIPKANRCTYQKSCSVWCLHGSAALEVFLILKFAILKTCCIYSI